MDRIRIQECDAVDVSEKDIQKAAISLNRYMDMTTVFLLFRKMADPSESLPGRTC